MTDYDYFLYYLRYKINDGLKQVAIAQSDKVNVSSAYINRLYKNPPKACSQKIQDGIAAYFGLTYDALVEEAKMLFRAHSKMERSTDNFNASALAALKQKRYEKPVSMPEVKADEPQPPLALIEQLSNISESIRHNYTAAMKIEEERDDLLEMLTFVKTGICIVDDDLHISFQNDEHKRMFGNKINKEYGLFWQKYLGETELNDRLLSEDYNGKIVTYNKQSYLIHVIVIKKIKKIKKVIEQVICLNEQDATFYDSLHQQDKKVRIYHKIFRHLDHGFGFFNADRVLDIASNKFDLIDPKYNFPENKPTVDQLLLDLSEKMKGGIKKISELKNAYENREEIDIEVQIGTTKFNFQTFKIEEDGEFQGILLVVRKI